VVSYSGALTNNQQHFSLILNGTAAEQPPPPPVAISSVSPTSGLAGPLVTIDLNGTSLGSGTNVKLTKSGQNDIIPTTKQLIGATLRCQFNFTGAATGPWSVVATNPDASTATLANAFTLIGAIWSENFDSVVSGWTSNATIGSNSWNLTSTQSHSPATSYFAPAPSSKTTTFLTSPSIAISSSATNLQFKFWHLYNMQTSLDAGRLEFSVNGGAWFIAGSSGSGTEFASNGYNVTINSTGKPADRNEFAGDAAWSGNSNGFIETIVNFTDTAKFAGKSLRARWCLSTNNGTATQGWHVDNISLIGGGDVSNQAPTITSTATSSSTETVTEIDSSVWRIERGTSAALTVAATDDGGANGLTYTWNVTGPAPVFVNPNGSNTSNSTTAEFESTGDYTATVTITDSQGLATNSSVNLRFVPTASRLVVSPAVASLTVGGSQTFNAMLNDQFGAPNANQPSSFTWNTSGGGSINSSGLFTATSAGGPFSVSAASGSFGNFASVTVNPAPATITLGSLNQTYSGSPRIGTATTVPPGLLYQITYEGSATAPVNAGSYAVEALITDPNYQGGDSGTLVVTKAAATVVLSNLNQTYDGSPKAVLVTTTPEGLAHEVTYDGITTEPSDASTYAVVATVTDPNHEGSANGILKIESVDDFTAWQQENFSEQQILNGLADDLADPENDGLCNLAEFALGADPWKFTPLPPATRDENGLTLTFTRPSGLVGIAYAAESSQEMRSWSPAQLEIIGSVNGVETVRAHAPLDIGDSGKRFIRLRFTRE